MGDDGFKATLRAQRRFNNQAARLYGAASLTTRIHVNRTHLQQAEAAIQALTAFERRLATEALLDDLRGRMEVCRHALADAANRNEFDFLVPAIGEIREVFDNQDTPHLVGDAIEKFHAKAVCRWKVLRNELTREMSPLHRLSYIDLGPLIEDRVLTIQRLQFVKGIRFQHNVESCPGLWDGEAWHGCLTNLVLNSVQAVKDSGRAGCIAISLTRNVLANKTYIDLKVSDNGIGMEPEVIQRIHRDELTTHPENDFRGLTQVRALAQANGGYITITSKPDVGSAVQVRVPATSLLI